MTEGPLRSKLFPAARGQRSLAWDDSASAFGVNLYRRVIAEARIGPVVQGRVCNCSRASIG